MSKLDNPITYLKGVGPAKATLLEKELEIHTYGDLLLHYPFRYIDRTRLTPISEISPDSQWIQIKGTITSVQTKGNGPKQRLAVTLADESGTVELVWFKGVQYFRKMLTLRKEYLVFGKPNYYGRQLSIPHPDIELLEGPVTFTQRLMPVYSSTEKLNAKGLNTKGIAKLVRTVFESIEPADVHEILPKSVLENEKFGNRYQAFINIHLPEDESVINEASRRLKFEEFFFFQIKLLQLKHARKKFKGLVFKNVGEHFNTFYKNLPFELTGAQKRVLKEIRRDTMPIGEADYSAQMNRLLQGDVGSGKTIVALLSMLIALDNGYQACMMAPTEILANQHFDTIRGMLKGMDINVEILTGSVKGKRRRLLLEGLELGFIHILIGTHALIEKAVKFKELGIAIIDEQHRFGVEQRSKLWLKSTIPPHVLVMTATPIPRTLAMTLYGDLDVSVIDELPPGRKAIVTAHRFEKDRLRVFGFMKEQIALGRQIYIVYPLIDESEHFDYQDLKSGFESIERAFPRPKYQVSVVHGQLHTTDKDFEMQRFKDGETNILVATTVIEVGVDVPNASVMIIESANRFGLSQLHQLRGRVGRGGDQSYCILLTDYKLSSDAKVRLQTMVDTSDGFKIAEVDMKLRGPGMIEGTQQSGDLGLRLADVIKDQPLLERARTVAKNLIEDDPSLEKPDNINLKNYLTRNQGLQRIEWSRIS